MRYIDVNQVRQKLPGDWENRAQAAHDEVNDTPIDERPQAINAQRSLWKELKDILKKVSHNKCWYCESIDIRSDNAVDHYRPKNRVFECQNHEGYWWLAFKWDNYRYSCTFCNSRRVDKLHCTEGGKHDHFPLLDETRRAYREEDDLGAEQPLLLDPICRDDPSHLWYDEDGQAKPNPRLCMDEASYPHIRAKTSIKMYHLNHEEIVERRKVLCQSIRKSVGEADYFFFEKYCKGDNTAKESFNNSVASLAEQLKADAEYSSVARATLMGLRGKSAVAEIVLAAGDNI